MTDPLLNAALAGTARAGGQLPSPTTPADALVTPAPDLGTERQLLLAAGARAVYRRAGAEPLVAAAPHAAPDDPAPICSPGASRLIAAMLTGQPSELLPEALDRLQCARQRLPHALLPAALEVGTRRSDLRPALLTAIGERGRWLAGQNHPWRWATARPLPADGVLPPDAEALWGEGPAAQRLTILRQVRAHDPAQGRAWLAATWKGEKADFRAEAIQALETGLSPDDEPFLEAALDDRSQAVRPEAAKLLARLPESGLSKRLRDRADTCLTFTPGLLAGGWRAAAKALVKGAAGGKLTVTPPEAYDKAWARDGIAEKPSQGTGARAWWLQQFLALIPPSHWSGRFAVDPATLIAAAETGDWAVPTLAGWAQATLVHRDEAWAVALWQYWCMAKIDRQYRHAIGQQLGSLAGCIPRRQAEQLLLGALARLDGLDDRLVPTMQHLPRPWSIDFASAVLRQARDQFREMIGKGNTIYYSDPWLALLPTVAVAIPPSAFRDALAIKPLAPGDALSAPEGWWLRRITDFTDLVQTRQRLMEEIPYEQRD